MTIKLYSHIFSILILLNEYSKQTPLLQNKTLFTYKHYST